ncbi:N,N'-diacetylbacillosaminyl-diphospho-undecaprenol alpha-1,3-N-acetylgalactosaminyltransferase [Lachnospiraceae bacterium]|nr:N,N'-diacetylbacillosaminyl-diphospho-undecaprenol alpha-1,3-N-acetylgalactosaminyltransferase [Lachnospiraceae bacterium]
MQLIQNLCSLSDSECFLVPGSGVDLAFFNCSELVPLGKPVVLMASRLLSTKGVREFVKAENILRQRGFAAEFQLAGSPDLVNPASIKLAEIEAWRKNGHIKILGYCSDIRQLMSSAHIVCLPSYYPEGLPRVLCEAAASGRVVVTTDEPGCRDAIINGVTGLLVPSRNAEALADALQYLLLNPELIRKMGVAARQYAKTSFDLDAVINLHLSIYSSLITS